MTKKIAIIVLIFISFRVLISCCGNTDNYDFNFTSISLTAGDNISNDRVSAKDTMIYSSLIIQIDFDYVRLSQMIKQSGINDLCAYDCKQNINPGKKVTNVQVISIGDFNDQILNGNEIESDFRILGYTDNDFTKDKYFVVDHLNKTHYNDPDDFVYLKFKSKPYTNANHRFAINIRFEDNTFLTDTTDLIYLNE